MQLKVVIEPDVYRKVMHWVNKSQYEVSGLGLVKVEPDGVLRVISAMLLPQKNGSTHTDIEPEAVCQAMFDLRNETGLLKWWWHSHVQMSVFWSGTDDATIKSFGAHDWILATVFNQKNEVRSAYYAPDAQNTPWGKLPLFLDKLDTKIGSHFDVRIPEWDAEYDKNVTNQSWRTATAMVPTVGRTVTSSVGTTAATSLYEKYDIDEIIEAKMATSAKHRPKGMTKKDWKAIKSLPDRIGQPPTSEERFGIDDYGFNQSERNFLAGGGFDENAIDELVDHDFTGLEILQMCEQGFKAQEILALMEDEESDYLPAEVMEMVRAGIIPNDDDTPVADRGRAC